MTLKLQKTAPIDLVGGSQEPPPAVHAPTTPNGQKFLTHQFTFLDPPIFLARKLILPTTSLKPAFLTHQRFRTSLEPPNRGKAKKLAVKFLRRAHRSFPNL
jgi:hypothetical protein